MSCSYCYITEYFDRGYTFIDPDIEQLFTLIDKLATKTYGLVLLGGEPLVRKDLHQLLKYARLQGKNNLTLAPLILFIQSNINFCHDLS